MATENAAIAALNLPRITFEDPPVNEPLRASSEFTAWVDRSLEASICSWAVMKTMPSPMTAIGLQHLYSHYLEDFRQFEPKHALKTFDKFRKLVETYVPDIQLLDEEGDIIIKGVKWATKEDIEKKREASFLATHHARLAGYNAKERRWLFISDHAAKKQFSKPDLYDANEIDADGTYRTWIKDHFVEAPQSIVDMDDLWLAFKAKFADPNEADGNIEIMNLFRLLHLVAECFLQAKSTDKVGSAGIENVRWKQLPESYTHSISVHNVPDRYPKGVREEAHKLLYLSKTRRAKAFLFTRFEQSKGVTVSYRSLWKHYDIAFARPRDTHDIAEYDHLLEILKKTFKGTETVAVSENHLVVLDIAPRKQAIPAQEYLSTKRQHDANRLTGPTVPKNLFNQKLMEQSMLALPSHRRSREYYKKFSPGPHNELKDLDASADPGPFIQRLRRRAHDQPLPLGDEEPGFPGVSMKAEQKRFKRTMKAWVKASATLYDPDPSNRPTTEQWANASRAAASVTQIQRVAFEPSNLICDPSTVPIPPSPPRLGAPGGVKTWVTPQQAKELLESGCDVEFRQARK